MKFILYTSGFLLIIVGVKWVLVAIGYNPVEVFLGVRTIPRLVVYGLVGLSVVYSVQTWARRCK